MQFPIHNNLIQKEGVSHNVSRIKQEDQLAHNRRLSFHSSSKPLITIPPRLDTKLNTKPKGQYIKFPLNLNKKYSWAVVEKKCITQKFTIGNKQNIGDKLETEPSKPKRFQNIQSREVLQFSKNKSNRKVKTLNNSNTPQQKANIKVFPAVTCFDYSSIVSKHNRQSLKQTTLQDFLIGRKLGKGKFGNVFFAVHKELSFICAIKAISKEKIKLQKYEERIIEQIKIQSSVSHPNIMELYGFFSDQDHIYLILEFCSSGDLYTTMKKKKNIQQKQSAAIIKQALEGLVHLHRKNIIHRDVKPENIMMEMGNVKIGDFGWASQGGLRKTFCGTPLYLSPQILLGEQYDERTDIWALGILAFQMLLGSNPFKIKTQGHLQRIIDQQIQFPEQPSLSLVAKDFISRVLQKNAKNRMDAEQLLLHPFVKHQ